MSTECVNVWQFSQQWPGAWGEIIAEKEQASEPISGARSRPERKRPSLPRDWSATNLWIQCPSTSTLAYSVFTKEPK